MPYVKETFQVSTLETAKHVALTTDTDNPNKFYEETDYFVSTLLNNFSNSKCRKWLDYGCGMGRVSLEIIKKYGDPVVGYDTSQSMLYWANQYIKSQFFIPSLQLPKNKFDVIICAFCLQHVEDVKLEVENIFSLLDSSGSFVLLNEQTRYVPNGLTDDNFVIWENDKIDVFEEVEKKFVLYKSVPYVEKSNLNINFYNRRD
tara:strand:- start:299 stop:904 length:606 start_codon:yes stop_codon:yes gene_type:complete